METSLKDLGIQNQALSFQEMTGMARDKRAVVQPPPPPSIPQGAPIIMPDLPMPQAPISFPKPQLPHPSGMNINPVGMQLPFAGVSENAIAPTASSQGPPTCNNPKPQGGFCLDAYQKEMMALAIIASAISSPMAQDKLGEFVYLRDNRLLKAAASGVLVAMVFVVIKKFVF
jgi:hypothetical protein